MPLALDFSFSAAMIFSLLVFFAPFVAMGFAVARWWVFAPLVAFGIAVLTFLVVNNAIYVRDGRWRRRCADFRPRVLILGGASAGLLLRRGWDTYR